MQHKIQSIPFVSPGTELVGRGTQKVLFIALGRVFLYHDYAQVHISCIAFWLWLWLYESQTEMSQ
jgi:hypothetical protein